MGVIVVVVIVVAMLVVMMVVVITAVIVIVVVVPVVIVVIVVTVIVPAMTLAMRMFLRRMARRIGAAFGIERRLDLDDPRAEPLHHRLDDVIAADAQALRHDLRRQMAVAEMPGDANQMQRISAADLDQRFSGRHHLDQPAVFQHQRIAAAQRDGIFEIEQEFQPARPRHRHAPPVPVVEIEHDSIGRGLRPAMLPEDLCRADHVSAPDARSVIRASSFETALRASSG